MIIECFGLPGSGKSTLVARLLKEDGFVTVPKYVNKTYAFLYFLRHSFFVVRFIMRILFESWKTRTWKLTRFKLSVFLNTIARLEYARGISTHNTIVLLDEGILQRMLSLFETKKEEDIYRNIFKNAKVLTDMVVHVIYSGNGSWKGKVGTKRSELGEVYAKNWKDAMVHNCDSVMRAAERLEMRKYEFTRDGNVENEFSALISELREFQRQSMVWK